MGDVRDDAMKTTYDETADVLRITLLERVPRRTRIVTREVAPAVYLDEAGASVVAIEILDASARIPRVQLSQFASPEQWLTVSEAAAHSGLAAQTLRAQIANGRLAGVKRGRDWTISLTALTNYLESRSARGRPPRLARARRRKASAR